MKGKCQLYQPASFPDYFPLFLYFIYSTFCWQPQSKAAGQMHIWGKVLNLAKPHQDCPQPFKSHQIGAGIIMPAYAVAKQQEQCRRSISNPLLWGALWGLVMLQQFETSITGYFPCACMYECPQLYFVKDIADLAVPSKRLVLFSLLEAYYASTIFLGGIERRI